MFLTSEAALGYTLPAIWIVVSSEHPEPSYPSEPPTRTALSVVQQSCRQVAVRYHRGSVYAPLPLLFLILLEAWYWDPSSMRTPVRAPGEPHIQAPLCGL